MWGVWGGRCNFQGRENVMSKGPLANMNKIHFRFNKLKVWLSRKSEGGVTRDEVSKFGRNHNVPSEGVESGSHAQWGATQLSRVHAVFRFALDMVKC